ncbi:MAG TPA: zinc metallopeptidase [Terrimicrobiaceae bacterium]|nr:zinc metallopeptidase [Terrimicrobiaceae bacterium]
MMMWLLLIGVPLLVGMWAQMQVSGAFHKWKQVAASSGVTGAQAAREILAAANIRDVEVLEINDMLGDHYDPAHKRLCLSTEVYRTPSVAALGIAAHECGHAIQHQKGYAPLQWRMAIVPVTQIASNMLPFIFLGGLFFGIFKLAVVAVGVYLVLTVFQLITLPVEFDASRRAKIILQQLGMVRSGEEAAGVNKVLNAAALTYVAAFVASLGTLLYYLMILTGNRSDER